jgi:hypothetical protein
VAATDGSSTGQGNMAVVGGRGARTGSGLPVSWCGAGSAAPSESSYKCRRGEVRRRRPRLGWLPLGMSIIGRSGVKLTAAFVGSCMGGSSSLGLPPSPPPPPPPPPPSPPLLPLG